MIKVQNVKGYCPMGCGQTLYVSEGFVLCSLVSCPNPGAIADLLQDGETEHIVVLGETGFDIQHPLRERVDGDLFNCGLHRHIEGWLDEGPPRMPGRYRVSGTLAGPHAYYTRWSWTPLPDDQSPSS